MKKTLFFVALIWLSFALQAQRYKTIELKPITKQGWNYYYDLNKVSSPIALEIPMVSIQDEEVNRYLKGSRAWRTVGGVITLVPVIYIISLSNNTYVDQSTFWWVFGGAILAQIGCEAMSHGRLGLAIDKYNMVIMQPSGNSLGVNVTWKFR